MKQSIENSTFDNLVGSISSLKNKIFWFKKYRNAYKSYFQVIKKVRKNHFPINAILKNGDRVILNNIDHVALFALLEANKSCSYDRINDEITVKLNGVNQNSIKIQGVLRNIDAVLTFSGLGSYSEIPIKDKIVIDIGASIGDTAIYFALRGAKKVIAIEPFPKNFEIAKKNTIQNNLSDKISILLAGAGAEIGTITIDPNYESSMRSKLKSFDHGVAIPIITLEKIIADNEISNAVLKIDCEGCEYDIMESASSKTLQKFDYIHVEYHAGYKFLKSKLQNSGFKIVNLKVDDAKNGHIFAKKIV